jgi:2-dehydro-3-deoxygluconokinase
MRLTVGGAESNVAIGVRRLGVPAAWIGRVGDDELGGLIVRELRAEQVAVRAITDPAPTGLMLKFRPSPGQSQVRYYRTGSAGSRLQPADLDWRQIASAELLHITGITPALGPGPARAVRTAIDKARAARVPVSLDVNYRAALWSRCEAAAALRPLLRAVDIVFAGMDEAALLVDGVTEDPLAAAELLAGAGPGQAVIKLGALGAVARIDRANYIEPAVPMPVVDTVGAGDAFVAGYLAETITGAEPARRLATAAAAGACAITVAGDWEGMPSRADLARLASSEPVMR